MGRGTGFAELRAGYAVKEAATAFNVVMKAYNKSVVSFSKDRDAAAASKRLAYDMVQSDPCLS